MSARPKKVEIRVLPKTPDTTEDTSQQEAFSHRLKRERSVEREEPPHDGSNKKAKAEQTEQPAQQPFALPVDNYSHQFNPAENYSPTFDISSILGNLPLTPIQHLPDLNNYQSLIRSQLSFSFPPPPFTTPASSSHIFQIGLQPELNSQPSMGNQFPLIFPSSLFAPPINSLYPIPTGQPLTFPLPLLTPPLLNRFYSTSEPQPTLSNNDQSSSTGLINNHPSTGDHAETTKKARQYLYEAGYSLPQPTPTLPQPDSSTSSSYSILSRESRSKSKEQIFSDASSTRSSQSRDHHSEKKQNTGQSRYDRDCPSSYSSLSSSLAFVRQDRDSDDRQKYSGKSRESSGRNQSDSRTSSAQKPKYTKKFHNRGDRQKRHVDSRDIPSNVSLEEFQKMDVREARKMVDDYKSGKSEQHSSSRDSRFYKEHTKPSDNHHARNDRDRPPERYADSSYGTNYPSSSFFSPLSPRQGGGVDMRDIRDVYPDRHSQRQSNNRYPERERGNKSKPF